MSSSNRRNSPLFWAPPPDATAPDAAAPDAAAPDTAPEPPPPPAPPVAAPPPPPPAVPPTPEPIVETAPEEPAVAVEAAPEEPAAEEESHATPAEAMESVTVEPDEDEGAPPDFAAPADLDAPREHAFSPTAPPGFEEDNPDEVLPSIDAINPFTDPPPPEADPFFEDETIAGVESLFDDEPGFVEEPHATANIDAPTEEMSRDQLFSDEAEMAFGLSMDNEPALGEVGQGLDEGGDSFDADLFDVDAFDEDVDDEWALKDPAAGKKRLGIVLAVLVIGGAFWWISQQSPEDGTLEDQIAAAEQEAEDKKALEEQVLADLAAKKDAGAPAEGEAEEGDGANEEVAEAAAPAPSVQKAATKPTPALRGTKQSPPPLPPEAMKPKPTKSRPTANKLVNAGWTAIGEGKFGNARKSFIDAVGLEPRNAMAHYGLGYAADKQGDGEAALKYFCKAQALSGGAGEVAREVEGILTRKEWDCP